MQLQAKSGVLTSAQADTYIVYLMEGIGDALPKNATQELDENLGGLITRLVQTGEFSGKVGEVVVIYPQNALPAKRVIVVGLGDAETFSAEKARRAVAAGMRKAHDLKAVHIATVTPGTERGGLDALTSAQALAEAAHLALYYYHGQKSTEPVSNTIEQIDVLSYDSVTVDIIAQGLEIGSIMASGTNLARELVNLPPNICTPMYLAQRVMAIGEVVGLRVQVLETQQMRALKMGALLAVAQGSETPPSFIIMEHRPHNLTDADTVVFVGKGVTFDTGGYSLKTADGMSKMKGDMAGAAAVIGAMYAIAQLKVPLHVVGLVPAADNMVSGKSYRPQEVITASNGKTIEIISTDAEGRLLLADALVYAQKYHPSAVVDIATLTGSCYVALGGLAAGLFCVGDTLQEALLTASMATHERLWPMPLLDDYDQFIRSDTADMKNSGGRYGGASIAARFLHHFVDYPAWAHIDMAGLELDVKDNPYASSGATGFGARLLATFARQWANRKGE